MKIHEYNEMMAYLTRPARTGFKEGDWVSGKELSKRMKLKYKSPASYSRFFQDMGIEGKGHSFHRKWKEPSADRVKEFTKLHEERKLEAGITEESQKRFKQKTADAKKLLRAGKSQTEVTKALSKKYKFPAVFEGRVALPGFIKNAANELKDEGFEITKHGSYREKGEIVGEASEEELRVTKNKYSKNHPGKSSKELWKLIGAAKRNAIRRGVVTGESPSALRARIGGNVSSWYDNWMSSHIGEYEVVDYAKLEKNLIKDYSMELENFPEKYSSGGGKGIVWKFAVSHLKELPSGYPNIFLTEKGKKRSFFRLSDFYERKLKSDSDLYKKALRYMELVVTNKVRKPELMRELREVLKDGNIIHLFQSKEGILAGSEKGVLFTRLFPKDYPSFRDKITSGTLNYQRSQAKIERALGWKPGAVQKKMDASHNRLAKIFNVDELPVELRYSVDHIYGMSEAARSDNKTFMKNVVNSVMGTTIERNKELGRHGYSVRRKKLTLDIEKGLDVQTNLEDLNRLTKTAYPELVKGDKPYDVDRFGKVRPTKEFVAPKNEFASYFKDVYQNKKGRTVLLRQLDEASEATKIKIAKILNCPLGMALGGRVGFATGSNVMNCITFKLDADPKGTLSKIAQAVPETRGAIMETLGPDGWRFLDVDYTPTEGRLSQMVGKLPKPIGSPLKAAGSMALKAGRWIFDPLSLGLIPVELAVMGAYNFAQNKEELEKALKDNPMVSEMAKKYKMSAEDVRNAILEKYRRASLGTETGTEEQMAFEPKHQKAVETFDKKFYPFWDPDFQTEGPQKTDTSFVKEEAFAKQVGEHAIGIRAAEEEKERMHRMGIARPDTAFGVEPEVYTKFYTKKEYYPKDYSDEALAGQLRSTKKIPFEALREGEEPLPEGGFYEGGRVGLKKGTFRPGRRTFLKGIGAGMLIPFAGKFFKFVGKKTAGKLTGPIIQKTAGMPDWFPGLVKRLYNEGDDVTKKLATKDLQVVKGGKLESGDDVHLYHDIDTGDVRVEVTPKKTKTGYGYETESGAYYKGYGAEVKKGETVVNKKGKATKTEDEFSIVEEEHVGRPEDVDFDIRETSVDDALTDLTEMEAFAKKKTTKQIHKKKGTKKKDVWPEFDDTIPEEDEFLP